MRDSGGQFDYWRLPSLALWLVFFGVGLLPEWVYDELRILGAVVTQKALINSPYLITVGFAGYLAVFCFNKCRLADATEAVARANALQNGVIALLAFLPLPLELLVQARDIPVASARHFIYMLGTVKLIAWWYLLLLFIRYYMSGNPRVFTRMASLLPSVRRGAHQDPPKVQQPPSTDQETEKHEAALQSDEGDPCG